MTLQIQRLRQTILCYCIFSAGAFSVTFCVLRCFQTCIDTITDFSFVTVTGISRRLSRLKVEFELLLIKLPFSTG